MMYRTNSIRFSDDMKSATIAGRAIKTAPFSLFSALCISYRKSIFRCSVRGEWSRDALHIVDTTSRTLFLSPIVDSNHLHNPS